MDADSDVEVELNDYTRTALWCHVVAGGVAGGVSRTCTAPLDRLKVFLQVYGGPKVTLRDCAVLMYKDGGFFGMWRGNATNVVKIVPEASIKFSVYESSKRLIHGNSEGHLTIAERFISGCVAGGVSQTIIYPLEVIKVRLAVMSGSQIKSVRHLMTLMYSHGGIRSFYRGYTVNIVGVMPYAGIDLAIYETLRNSFGGNEHPTAGVLMFCAATSTACGQAVTYPVALMRTQLQAQDSRIPMQSPVVLFRKILREQGFRGLYRGILPNFVKVVPCVCISYWVFERTRSMLSCSMT